MQTNAPRHRTWNMTRRDMLVNGGAGFGALALAQLMGSTLAGEETAESLTAVHRQRPHHKPTAKSVIFVFLEGGPSHIDLFDPKPKLAELAGSPLPSSFKPVITPMGEYNAPLLASKRKWKQHGECGAWVSDWLPEIATCVDDIAFIKSCWANGLNHSNGVCQMNTGSIFGGRPSLGAWASYGLGTENENLPAFVTICPTLAHGGVNNWGAAFLPAYCQGTPIGNASLASSSATVKHVQNNRISPELQKRQLDLIASMNRDHLQTVGSNQALEGRLNAFELAFRMQATMPEAQDLATETDATKRLYGLDDPVTEDFGRQCLLARRFLERGVRFVQVTHSDSEVQWDQHSDLYHGHTKNAVEVDKPIAGFLADLKTRGLLKDTLVLWGGEFGRTPTAQGNNGRDHNPHGFTMWMAGAGVKGGFAYGATDDYGYYAAENKMHVHDLHATILHALGLDHERLTYRYAGRDFRLTDVAGQVATDIFA